MKLGAGPRRVPIPIDFLIIFLLTAALIGALILVMEEKS